MPPDARSSGRYLVASRSPDTAAGEKRLSDVLPGVTGGPNKTI